MERGLVVEGIAYRRGDRRALRRAALEAIDAGDPRTALALLLTDQDRYAPLPPPSVAAAHEAIEAVDRGASLREAMQALNFGPVADYFAYRSATPTFLSGLALLASAGKPVGPVIEFGCGIGHFLRVLAGHGVPAIGVDVVFAKLWLARRFVAPQARLVCASAADAALEPVRTPTVFCHDAFYFFDDKAGAARHWRQLAEGGGRVLVGHAHNALVEQSVAGTPLAPHGYAELFPGCALYDDEALGASALAGDTAEAQGRTLPARPRSAEALSRAEAVSLIWPAPEPQAARWADVLLPPERTPLRLEPLLHEREGRLEPRWPSARFEAEYGAAAGYLSVPVPEPGLLARAAGGRGDDPRLAALARRHVLADLPERW